MSIKCAECNEETLAVVDTEKDVKGRSFVLLECRKCRRAIIVPQEQWRESEEPPAPSKRG